MNANKITICQNLWDSTNAGFRRSSIALNTYVGKEERFQINDFNFHLKKQKKENLGKQQKKGSTIIKVEFNETEKRQSVKPKADFLGGEYQ